MSETTGIPDVNLDAALAALGLAGAHLVSDENRATDTRVWQVLHEDRLLAIRVYRETQQDAMKTELQGMRLAGQHDIPVPDVVSTGVVIGRFPAMAIDWLPGSLVGDAMFRNPARARRLGASAGKLLARLHAIPKSAEPESSILQWDWISRAGDVDDWLRAQLESANRESTSLLHLDFHPHNLMTSDAGVTGVLDWTNAVFGDPRADVAHAVTLMRVVAPAIIAPRGAHRMAMGMYTRAFLTGYESAAGQLRGMAPFYAWAGCVIHRDLAPKADAYPVSSPARFLAGIERWTEKWLERARTSAIPG